jgi:Domain of unknown function (DUF4386)
MSKKATTIALSAFVIVESLLIFAPLVILGAAIGWPDSLDFPVARVLPLIAQHIGEVRLGYGIYLLYSLLWIALGASVAWLACHKEGNMGILVSLATTLGCVSAVARCIGIIRWLTASTEFSTIYPSATDMAANRGIEAAQMAVNAWGGAIGEVLGVALIASAWLVVVSIIIVTNKSLPKILGYIGFLVAIIVALPAAELFGLNLMSVSAATSAMHFWLLAVGITGLVQAFGQRSDAKLARA